jgi:uroporphyrin-III C-methyltransferase
VAIVQDATLPGMRVLETTLGEAAAAAEAAGLGAPAIVCVGRNVLLRQAIDWAGQLEGQAPRALDPLGRAIADAS